MKSLVFDISRAPHRVLALFLTMALTAGMFTFFTVSGTGASPAVAAVQADADAITLTSQIDADGMHADLAADLSNADYGSTDQVSLYRNGSTTAVASKTADNAVGFQVALPNVGYDEYYVKLKNDTSNTVSVNSASGTWAVSLSRDRSSFSTAQGVSLLSWQSSQTLNGSGNFFYIADETGAIVYRTGSDNNGSYRPARFVSANQKTYKVYVATADNGVSNVSQLSNLLTVSNSVTIYRTKWQLSLSINHSVFDTSSAGLQLTMNYNQPLWSNYDTTGAYRLYVYDTTAGKLLGSSNNADTTSMTLAAPRFQTGDTHSYVAYIAQSGSNSDNPNDLTGVQATSQTVTATRVPWTVSLSIDRSSFDTSNPAPKLTATVNQPFWGNSGGDTSGTYRLYIYDLTAGTKVADFLGDQTIYNVTVNRNFAPGTTHQFVAYVAKNGNSDPDPSSLQGIQATSETVSTSQSAWAASMSIDKTTFSTETGWPSVTVDYNQPLWGNYGGDTTGRYMLYIYDLTAGTRIAATNQAGDTTYRRSIPQFRNGGDTHTYVAYIAASGDNGQTPAGLTDIQAVTGTVSTTALPWTATLSIDRTTFSTNTANSVLTIDYNQSIYAAPGTSEWYYAVYVYDTTTNTRLRVDQPANTRQLKVTVPRYRNGTYHTVVAYIAKAGDNGQTPAGLTEIQAITGTVSTLREQWSLGLTAIATPNNNSNPPTANFQFTATPNQPLYSSTGSADWSWTIYLYDLTAGTRVATMQDSNTTTLVRTQYNQPLNAFHNYIAYVADSGDNGQTPANLINVQAISNEVYPAVNVPGPTDAKETTGGGNGSTANCQCGRADPVNTLTGEFYENATDLSVSTVLPFDFTRTYSSTSATASSSLGKGWRNNYDMSISSDSAALLAAGQVTITQESGATVTFNRKTDGTYVAPYRVLATLTYNAATNKFTLLRNNGYAFVFDADTGRLVTIRDLHGNQLSLTYTAGNLTKIQGADGKFISLTWANGLIDSINDNAGRSVYYTYDADGYLTHVSSTTSINGTGYTYDPADGQLTSITTPNGAITTNFYTSGKVTKQIRPDNKFTTFSYDVSNSGTVTTITNPDQTVTRDVYNTYGQISSITKAYGTADAATTSYVYGVTGQPVQTIDPIGHITYISYDTSGNVTSATDGNGNTTTMVYNSVNQLLSTTNAAQNTATNTYDGDGNLTEAKDFENHTTKYAYDTAGRVKTIEAPEEVTKINGKKTEIHYDDNGFVDKVTSAEGVETSMNNNTLGQPSTKTDGAGNTTEYHYDSLHRLSWTKAPNGAETHLGYDNAGRIETAQDPEQRDTTYTYDDFDNVLSEISYLGTTSYTYNDALQLKQKDDYAGRTFKYTYDLRGNLTRYTDPNTYDTKYTYYDNDLPKTTVDANNHTTTLTYDNNGNLIGTTDAQGKTTLAQYDELNRQKQVTTAEGITTKYAYNENGLLTQTTFSDNSTTKTEYDANGNPTKTTDQAQQNKTYTYNADNNLLGYTDEASKTTSYHYNDVGQLDQVTRPDTSKKYYNYTNTGQIHQTSFDNFATLDTEYTYNLLGQVTSEKANGVETQYGYDPKSNLTYRGPPVVAGNTADGVSYTYNTKNELATETYPSGVALAYDYDDAANLLSVKKGNQTLAAYTYDPVNNVTGIAYGNGTNETRGYNNNDQLTNITVKKGTISLYSQDSTVNDDGLTVTDNAQYGDGSTATNVAKSYTYDGLQQLASVTKNNSTSNYAYNATKNLTSSPTSANSYNNVGQILTAVTSTTTKLTYGYDDRGNRITVTPVDTTDAANPVNGTATTYAWTENDELAKVQLPDATLDYTYDASGLMTSRTKSYFDMGNTQPVTSKEDYVWDTVSSIPTLIEDGANSYIYGIGIAPFAQINKTTGDLTYLYGDRQGSVVATANNSGNLVSTYQYDAYGNTTDQTGDTGHFVTPFAYTGAYLDADISLYNLRARWYDSSTWAFLSLDPAVLSTGKGYTYASANPLLFSDPLGLYDHVGTALSGWTDAFSLIAGGLPSSTIGWVINHKDGETLLDYSPSASIRRAFGVSDICTNSDEYRDGTKAGYETAATIALFFVGPLVGAAGAGKAISGLAKDGQAPTLPRGEGLPGRGGSPRAVEFSTSDVLDLFKPGSGKSLSKNTDGRSYKVNSAEDLNKIYDSLKIPGSEPIAPTRGIPNSWFERPDGIQVGKHSSSNALGDTIDIRVPDSINVPGWRSSNGYQFNFIHNMGG